MLEVCTCSFIYNNYVAALPGFLIQTNYLPSFDQLSLFISFPYVSQCLIQVLLSFCYDVKPDSVCSDRARTTLLAMVA